MEKYSALRTPTARPQRFFPHGPEARIGETLLDLYKKHGIEFVERLRGAFSLAIWDGPAEALYLASDRHGLRPLYYRQTAHGVAFASEVKALLTESEESLAVDECGIADYLVLGVMLGTRTFFRDIQLVPSASILTFRNGKKSTRRYWDLRYRKGDDLCADPGEGARLFKEVFLETVGELTACPGTFEIPLSGGMDSRCLAVAARACGRRARTYTLGSDRSDDLRLGPQVAGRLGFSNESWALTPRDLIDWTPEAVYLTDGMSNPFNSPILFMAKRLPADAQVVIDGTSSFDGLYRMCDLVLNRIMPSKYSMKRLAIDVVCGPVIDHRGRLFDDLFTTDYGRVARESAGTALDDFAGNVPTDQRANPFNTLDFLDHVVRIPRHNMMGTVLLRSCCEVRHPYLDPRVVDLVARFMPLLRTREKLVLGRFLALQEKVLGGLEYERTGLPADASILRHFMSYRRNAAKCVLRRVLPAIKETPRQAINFGQWLRRDRDLQGFVRGVLLDGRMQARGYFRPESVRGLVDDLLSGREHHLPIVGRMISLELWHRYFLEGEAPVAPAPC